MRARQLIVPVLAAAALTIAGCGSDDGADGAVDDEATTADEVNEPVLDESDDGSDDADAAAATEVVVLDTDMGEVLATADEQVLYIFDADDEGDSACVDECADLWPPLGAEYSEWPDSVTAEISTFARPDGTEQVSVGGLPVYTYVADGPGDTEGQGVGGAWWVLDAEGIPDRSQP
ncbi:MAG: hypothetical protein JJU45_03735 [Acidimicrobiia bacterium]|nr:hypothetical protein [Acidimicrobiia bacterium]